MGNSKVFSDGKKWERVVVPAACSRFAFILRLYWYEIFTVRLPSQKISLFGGITVYGLAHLLLLIVVVVVEVGAVLSVTLTCKGIQTEGVLYLFNKTNTVALNTVDKQMCMV